MILFLKAFNAQSHSCALMRQYNQQPLRCQTRVTVLNSPASSAHILKCVSEYFGVLKCVRPTFSLYFKSLQSLSWFSYKYYNTVQKTQDNWTLFGCSRHSLNYTIINIIWIHIYIYIYIIRYNILKFF